MTPRYRFTLPLLGALAMLAGCGGSPTEQASEAASPSSAATEAAAPATADPTLAALDDAPGAATPAPAPQSGPISCAADIGESAARTLVAQCRAVSPATRPPCNAANSCAMIRNEVARGCALLAEDAAATPECAIEPISREAAADLVSRFYAAINARDYASAWSLWGPDGNPEQTLDEFTRGYLHTRRTHVEIGKVSDVEGGAGSIYVTVPVTIDAELDSGRRQRFTGSYDLRQINRGMGRSQGWHIMSAKLKPA
ncbi:MAG TPA: hypothetical protein VMQ93_03800 [Novosphingobium sp.]|nr:hypothetical protein [Novosphingobium sp.]